MVVSEKSIFQVLLSLLFVGCASTGQFYDSAMNDHNRAPASVALSQHFADSAVIDPARNQAEADFLFLKSEMESNVGHDEASIQLLREALVYDPESATLMQKLAIANYKAGNIPEAISWAEKAEAQDPSRRDLHLLVAGLYTTSKDYTKAQELYGNMVKQDAHDGEAMLYLGAIYTELEKYTAAVKIFRKLGQMKDFQSAHLVHYYLARVYSEQAPKKVDRVIAELKKSVELKPDFFDAVSMLGHLYEKKYGPKKAYEFYADYQKKYGPNVKVAEILSQHYISVNDYDRAFEQLEIQDEAGGDDQIQIKLKMALILIEKKMYDPAIAKLQEILKVAPESDKVRFYLSAVYEENKQYKDAVSEYLKIDSSSSYFEEAHLHAAFLEKAAGKTDKAQAILQQSIEKGVQNPQSYFLQSQIFEEQKQSQKALDLLKNVEEKFSANPQYYYYMGTLEDRMNLKNDMLESMKKVVELDPNHAQALNYIAYTWAEQGQFLGKAEEYAKKAVLAEQGDAFILDTLGWVLFKKGQYKEAISILQKAHAMQPEVSIISEHLGDVYSKMNVTEKARTFFMKAAEQEEDTSRKTEIQSKLSKLEERVRTVRTPSSVSATADKSASP